MTVMKSERVSDQFSEFLKNEVLRLAVLFTFFLTSCKPQEVTAYIKTPLSDTATTTFLPTEIQTPTETATETATATELEQKVYTQAELEAMVPTKEEMIAFLNSDEIVRIKELDGRIVPLGISKMEHKTSEVGGYYHGTLNAIPWGEPILADVIFNGSTPIRTMLVPVVSIQDNDNTKPVFLYVFTGDQGKASVDADIAYGDEDTSSRQASTLEKLSWYIERGRQTEILFSLGYYYFDENFDEKAYLEGLNLPPVILERSLYNTEVFAQVGTAFLDLARDIAEGKTVEKVIIGKAEYFSFQAIGHPSP